MNRIPGIAAAPYVLAAGCKKDDSGKELDPDENVFAIDGNKHPVKNAYTSNTGFYGEESLGDFARVTFYGSAARDGSYAIAAVVRDLSAARATLRSQEGEAHSPVPAIRKRP